MVVCFAWIFSQTIGDIQIGWKCSNLSKMDLFLVILSHLRGDKVSNMLKSSSSHFSSHPLPVWLINCFFSTGLSQLRVNCWFELMVWIPSIPFWKGVFCLELSLESQTTGTQTKNAPLADWDHQTSKAFNWWTLPLRLNYADRYNIAVGKPECQIESFRNTGMFNGYFWEPHKRWDR